MERRPLFPPQFLDFYYPLHLPLGKGEKYKWNVGLYSRPSFWMLITPSTSPFERGRSLDFLPLRRGGEEGSSKNLGGTVFF